MKVVLTRAGGPLADRLVPRLLAAGHDVRVPPPPDGVPERRRLPVGVRPDDGREADVVVAISPDPEALRPLAQAGVRVLVVTDRQAAAVEDVLAAGGAPWTLQVTGVLHEDLARALQPSRPLPRAATVQPVDADEVAERIVRLLRVAPAGRVPDVGGPERLTVADLVPDAGDGPRPEDWPADWLEPRRPAGTVGYLDWSRRHAPSAAPEAVEGRDEPQGADALGLAPGVVQQG